MSSLTLLGKVIAAIIVLIIACIGLLYYTVKESRAPGTGGPSVACTQEAMQCPDGSWVGRTGPNCMFVCPAATSTAGVSSTTVSISTSTTSVATSSAHTNTNPKHATTTTTSGTH